MTTIGHNRPPLERIDNDATAKRLMADFVQVRATRKDGSPGGKGFKAYRHPGPLTAGKPIPGLYLLIASPTNAAWLYRYMRERKRHDMGLGKFPAINCEKAIRKAQDLRETIKAGNDPAVEKRRQRAPKAPAKAGPMTFGQATTRWLATNPQWSRKYAIDAERNLTGFAAGFAGKDIREVSKFDVVDALTDAWPAKRAKLGLMFMANVFDWAKDADHFAGDNPAQVARRLLGKGKVEVKHLEAVPLAEVPALMAQLGDGAADRALAFTILTAVRADNALEATWDQFDFGERLWHIPKTKNGDGLTVPLSDAALALLGERREGPIFGVSRDTVLRRLKALAGDAYTIHGFRSVFGAWGDKQGYNRTWIEKALGHRERGEVAKAYHRDPLIEERRPMMQAWSDAIMGGADAGRTPAPGEEVK